MNYIALKMLVDDRAKYLGLIFSIAFAAFLISHQCSIFAGLMSRTTSQIKDVTDASVWVMDASVQYVDEVKALPETELYRVRAVSGVEWAVRLFKGLPTAKAADGRFRTAILMGLDDASLAGAPRNMLVGSIDSLREPDAVVIDLAGYRYFYPDGPLELGRELELNDRRARIVGICNASAPFQTFPVMFSRYSVAMNYVGPQRNMMSFILAEPKPGVPARELAARIGAETGLKALTGPAFGWATIMYYIRNTGIPVNFGITVIVALIVGTVVSGQTFYIFAIENMKHFGALKAIGVTDARLTGMILLQAALVGFIGYALGICMTTVFFLATKDIIHLRGFIVYGEIAAGTFFIILFIIAIASLLSIRRVRNLEPAAVFRG
jgi:putative ABC transport system permease protein